MVPEPYGLMMLAQYNGVSDCHPMEDFPIGTGLAGF
jgi:hypothetical protein